jgi:Domain of unknown function (DUF4405)
MKAARIPLRNWATPPTVGSFFLMAATGVLMVFEWERGPTSVVHQWFSWLFLAGAGGHIAANLRPFKDHLKSGWGRASVAVFMVVLVASFLSWGIITGPQLKRPIERAPVDAPLSALAIVTHTDPDTLTRRLKARGIIADSRQSIRDLSGRYDAGENRLLAIVLLPE